MGATCSTEPADSQSRKIDRELAKEKDKALDLKKLLLLGAGECGKSTILKQVRILHDDTWATEDNNMEKMRIYSNIITGAVQLCAGVEVLGMVLNKESETHYIHIKTLADERREMEPFSPFTARALKALWADPTIKKAYELRSKLQVADSIKFFLEAIDRIADRKYTPSNDDYLHIRIPTAGVVEHRITIDGSQFAFIDVGGQKSERKKWISQFENVTSVIFISAVSEFDQQMNEDVTTNRLVDSMKLYQDTVKNSFFENSAIILFLNKTDLFKEKIKHESITYLFKKYQGPNTYEDSISYIENQFLNRSQLKVPYVHYTCATDTDQVNLVIRSVIDSILKQNLQIMGMT